MGVVDGGGGGGGVVLFGLGAGGGGVVLSGSGVTEGVTEGGGVVDVNSASGMTEVVAGVTSGVVLVLWRRNCGLEPS